TTLVRAMKRGQRCWRNVEHPESRELRTLPREIAGFRDILNCPLSSRTTPVPFLPIPRLHPGPVFGPRRGAACASTCPPRPRVELAVGVHERAPHLDQERPPVDGLAVHLAVVPRVRGEDLVELARDAVFERYRCQGPDPPELHSCLASVYGPGKTTPCVTKTVNG